MSRIEGLNNALNSLQASSSDIEACAIVSEDGLIIASLLPQGVEEERVAAMSAAMLSMGERIAIELKRGELEQLYVKGKNGYFIGMHAGEHAVLIALARKDAKLGLIFFDLNKAAETTKGILL
ncbi:roadblock/LC7 domain-containing protein [Geomonas sp. Red32]|uniref:roadblock/LC7 domain-containing protein n=1 Tax=Geomonas sp. Red32 TaxID=2912856 RepID=UPI00202CE6E1|nr:roadblock/LC7 domain-containing protein [Geomonas sp. Red32]MCM0082481.1 roadblock/LC7 domain-containing protein [Geomonas sp. Red32]